LKLEPASATAAKASTKTPATAVAIVLRETL
jgi:hypothetical protein